MTTAGPRPPITPSADDARRDELAFWAILLAPCLAAAATFALNLIWQVADLPSADLIALASASLGLLPAAGGSLAAGLTLHDSLPSRIASALGGAALGLCLYTAAVTVLLRFLE